MKKQRKIEKDNRGVAIYARKSRITNKGDSIGVQFKQCADYAKKELGLDEEYEFLQYEDKGLSGYFSDRPDFQRMPHDVQDGKIKAIVCYKLDRVGRKTADLIRLMDFLEMTVFCKHFLDKVAKHFWTLLQVQIGQSCKASTGSYPASRIAIADNI